MFEIKIPLEHYPFFLPLFLHHDPFYIRSGVVAWHCHAGIACGRIDGGLFGGAGVHGSHFSTGLVI